VCQANLFLVNIITSVGDPWLALHFREELRLEVPPCIDALTLQPVVPTLRAS